MKSKLARTAWVKGSMRNFFTVYFGHYMDYAFAPFQEKLFSYLQDKNVQHIIAMVFRGGGKSSICTTAFPLWAILGKHQAKHVLLVSRTIQQAQQHLENIKKECEDNSFLKRDFGEVFEKTTPWNTVTLSFSNVNAQITAVSAEQSVRGIRHGANRPDLIILDDVEDIASVKTKESRNKLFEWFTGDLLPAGNEHTRLIIVGNNLHNDSLLNRLINRAKKGQFDAEIVHQPIVNEDGSHAWPARFPDKASLDAYRRTIPSDRAWRQEMMLELLPPEEQIIHDSWLRYYDELSEDAADPCYIGIGIDLAISQKKGADKTAMVQAQVIGRGEDMKLYILPHPVNAQLTGAKSLEKIMELVNEKKDTYRKKVFVESVAYQQIIVELLRSNGVQNVYEYHPGAMSKEDRLKSISGLIESGRVLFPKYGVQELIDQLIGFGVERYDDLADALSALVINAVRLNKKKTRINVAFGDLDHIYSSEEMKRLEHDVEIEMQTEKQYIANHQAMNEQYAKDGLIWLGPGQWKAI